MNESKIKEFLDSWTKGVIAIGKAYSKKEDFEKEALKFLSNTMLLKLNRYFLNQLLPKKKYLEIT